MKREMNRLAYYDLNLGDCLDCLKKIKDNSIDAMITDPPAGISFMGNEWDSNRGGKDLWVKWLSERLKECYRVLKPGAHIIVWALPKTSHWTASAIDESGFEIRDIIHHIFSTGFPKTVNIDKKKEEFLGYSSSLKPAAEHWILARKPIKEKTILEQMRKNGCGAINSEKCRIPCRDGENAGWGGNKSDGFSGMLKKGTPDPRKSRFPSNVIVSGDALNDGTITKSKSGVRRNNNKGHEGWSGGTLRSGDLYSGIEDSGSRSRYFDLDLWSEKNGILYIPKPSTSERERGCDDLSGRVRYIGPSGIQVDEKIVARGRNPENQNKPKKNIHPTVKPFNLMCWFVNLISKKGDYVLDPFMGSGTTGMACFYLDRNFVGIEINSEYMEISKARIDYYKGK
jgi:DNA modification methylase